MPELAPYVDDATTWAERSALYAELLDHPAADSAQSSSTASSTSFADRA